MLAIKKIFSRYLISDYKVPAFLISAVLSFPLALVASMLWFTILEKDYSFRNLAHTAPFAFILLIVIIWFISKKFLIHTKPTISNLRWIHIQRFIVTLIILITVACLTWVSIESAIFNLPQYKHEVDISPLNNSAGEICILEIVNDEGIKINKENKNIFEVFSTDAWVSQKNGCQFFFPGYSMGSLKFNYVGPLDDLLTFRLRRNEDSGNFLVRVNGVKASVFNLFSEQAGDIRRHLSLNHGAGMIAWNFIGTAGLTAGILVFLMKIWIRPWKKVIRSHPVLWVLAGFLVVFLLFFVFPVFLNWDRDMAFPRYIPSDKEIGDDLRLYLNYSQSRLIEKEYIGNYPPIPLIVFFPLTYINFTQAYKLLTAINIICFILVTLIIPIAFKKNKKDFSIITLIFITSLFSYGFQFELERGQFNIITLAICFSAIYLFHYKKKYRMLSYILFSLSIQLKLWPGIFIFLFIDNWEDWKNIIKRFFFLLVPNFLALFILGYQTFASFVDAISVPPYIWEGNHSVTSFAVFMKNLSGLEESKIGFIEIASFSLIGLCILLIIVKSYRDKKEGLNEILLMACTIGACVIPSISHDYKLSIIPAAVVITLNSIIPINAEERKLPLIIFTFFFSIVFSITLFSYVYKPSFLENSFPALIVVLIMSTGIFLFKKRNPK